MTIASLIIAVISMVISFAAVYYTRNEYLQVKKDSFQTVSQLLITEKDSFLDAYRLLCNEIDINAEQRNYLLKEHASNYCNAFEMACQLYLKNAIDKDLFRETFKDEVKTIVNGYGVAFLLDNPPQMFDGEVYSSIVTVAEEWGIVITNGKKNYKVITLCGSTRFKDEYMEAQKRLTLEGNIVISVGLFGHSGDSEVWENLDEGSLTKTKEMLDDMHKHKIDMADEIFVINVGGYIGDSTRSEIEYAKEHGKPVNYLEPIKA